MAHLAASTATTVSPRATRRAFRVYGTGDEIKVLELIDQTFAGDVSYDVATEPNGNDAVFAMDAGHFERLLAVLDDENVTYKEYPVRPFSALSPQKQAELRGHVR